MNSKKMLFVSKLIVVFALLSFVLPSCSKDDEAFIPVVAYAPAFVGTWQLGSPDPQNTSRTLYVFSDTSFNFVSESKISGSNEWRINNGLKGSIGVVDDIITCMFLQKYTLLYDSIGNEIGGYYTKETTLLNDSFKWSVSNNILLILQDSINEQYDSQSKWYKIKE